MLNTRVLYNFEYTLNLHLIQREILTEFKNCCAFFKKKIKICFQRGYLIKKVVLGWSHCFWKLCTIHVFLEKRERVLQFHF